MMVLTCGNASAAALRKVPRPQVGSRIADGLTPIRRSRVQTWAANSGGVWKSPYWRILCSTSLLALRRSATCLPWEFQFINIGRVFIL